ncbi:MAG: isoprenylcysteine carboxylmethyltransferase family protein [Thermoanaerobaculia bacterium]|nr:isoprenylcysteine carboxylmethyltransferase family protein [Thermoanaerobaculia bacterium]
MKLLANRVDFLPLPGRLEAAVALTFLGLGVGLILTASRSFRRHRTTVNPTRPTRSRRLVTTGLYRWSRNPIYLGLLCLLVAWAFRLSSPASLVLTPLFVLYLNRYQIVPEERALEKIFGEAFEEFCRQTRRWI